MLSEKSDIIFVVLNGSCGACHFGIIESVIKSLLKSELILIKSLLLYALLFLLELLINSTVFICSFSEANTQIDFKNTGVGFWTKRQYKRGTEYKFLKLTREILNTNVISGNIENEKSLYVETKAEAIKLFKNTFLVFSRIHNSFLDFAKEIM